MLFLSRSSEREISQRGSLKTKINQYLPVCSYFFYKVKVYGARFSIQSMAWLNLSNWKLAQEGAIINLGSSVKLLRVYYFAYLSRILKRNHNPIPIIHLHI